MISLEPGETILLKARKRWFVIFTHAFMMALLTILPIVLVNMFVLPLITSLLPLTVISESDVIFYCIAWVWFVWMMFVVMWTNYYMDVLVVTNRRIIDMEQFVLFSREEVTIPLDRVEDVTIEIKGLLPTLLKFGKVQIQTAGAKREAVMFGIKNPEEVKNAIDSVLQVARREEYPPVEEVRGS